MPDTPASDAFWATLSELIGEPVERCYSASLYRVWAPALRRWLPVWLDTRGASELLGVSDYQVRKRIETDTLLADRDARNRWRIPTLPLLRDIDIEYLRERPGKAARPVSTTRLERPTSVYLYRDADEQLLYVGITSRGPRRQEEHARWSEWFHLAASSTLEHYPTRAEAEARELELIRAHRPPFNVRDNPDRRVAA